MTLFQFQKRLSKATRKLTHVCDNLICACLHNLVVVPRPELGERRKSRDLHPYLEVLIAGQLGELGVAIGITGGPIWRRQVIGRASWRIVGVLLVFIVPGDSLVGKVVGLSGSTVCIDCEGQSLNSTAYFLQTHWEDSAEQCLDMCLRR